MMVLSTLRRLFYKHPYIGNAVFYTCLLTSADFVCQKMQFGMLANYDWGRTGRMATMGFFYYGPASTFIYNNLDKILPGTGPKVVFKKLLIDQFVITCVSTSIFYIGKFDCLYSGLVQCFRFILLLGSTPLYYVQYTFQFATIHDSCTKPSILHI